MAERSVKALLQDERVHQAVKDVGGELLQYGAIPGSRVVEIVGEVGIDPAFVDRALAPLGVGGSRISGGDPKTHVTASCEKNGSPRLSGDSQSFRRPALNQNSVLEVREGPKAVGLPLDDLDPVGDAFGIRVGHPIGEVVEDLAPPPAHRCSELGELRDAGAIHELQPDVECHGGI
jgi:hypothetical protein